MIYLKNTIDIQDIYIPRLSIVTPSAPKPTYEQGYKEGYKEGYEDGAANIQIDLENKSIDIVSNGEYTVTPTDGFDALESVKISVDVQNGGECNLEDKIIAPQTNEVDGNGWIYVYPNEGYDGILEVALQTSNLKNGWYNEGYEQGKVEGGGGNCNLSHQLEVIETNGRHIFYPQNNGWNGFDLFEVEVGVPTTAKLQDVWVTPSMNDVDGNNLLVYSPNTDEGYDGLSRVVIDPQTIYNEGINSCAVDYPYTHLSFYTFRGDLFEMYKNSFDFTECFTNANDEYIPNEDFMIMLTDGFPSKITVRCKQYIKGCYKMPIGDNLLYGFDEVLFNNLEEVYFADYDDNDTTSLTFMEVGDLRMSYITFRNLLRIYADVNSFYIGGCDLGTNRENGECTLYPLNENAKEMINSLSSEWVLDTTSKIILK